MRGSLTGILTFFALASAFGQDAPRVLKSEDFKNLPLRAIGPALTPGRVGDIAVDPKNKSTWYVAMSSGGVWKTTNAGLVWRPIFDDAGSYSIGCITLDPKDSETLWVGTGENQSQRSVGYGDGVYKSTDGGTTWKNMGLKRSEHIAKIIVDPKKSDTVYVASQGPLWAKGGDRGVFKTTDGGASWESVLAIGADTGVTDLVMDPKDPDVLYAAGYQRRRGVGVLIGGGPESAIHKSTDGGKSWKQLTEGLPDADKGRIALAISPQKPNVLYALFNTAKEGAFYRSDDSGATWARQSAFTVLDWQYFGRIIPDPHAFDRVWIMDLAPSVTDDGGKTFKKQQWPVHPDHHALWIDPSDKSHLLSGNDGGLYESRDAGKSWNHFLNLPTEQFYRVGVDDAKPFYNVYGGSQDNGSIGGPHRSINRIGVRTTDWFGVGGGDGFQVRVEPGNPDVVYSLVQNGGLSRGDLKTGISKSIRPPTGMEKVRWHWDSPLIVSPHDPKRIYFGGSKLFRSDDRGDTWKAVSKDLTRNLDPLKIPVMGKIWGDGAVSRNTYTTSLSVITAIAESPEKEGRLIVGTDDGLIQLSDDGGETWTKIEKIEGIPAASYCTDVVASAHRADTLFATFYNWQRGDFAPHIATSADFGKTWKVITGDLPAKQGIWCLVEDPVNPDLLFAGAEFGLSVTLDGGKHWIQWKAGAPTIQFRDLEIQKREGDVVCATFGRGFYILDDIGALRGLTAASLKEEAVLLPVRKTYLFAELPFARPAGTFTAPNPPAGACITVYLKEATKEKLSVEIRDGDGKVIRTYAVGNGSGLQRLHWDMRTGTGRVQSVVKPGKFTATLVKAVGDKPVTVGEPRSVELVPLP